MDARRVARVAFGLAIAALIATFVAWIVSIFALDKARAYGRMELPGSAVVHLPAGQVDVAYHEVVNGGNDESISVPALNISAVPANGDGPPATVVESSGASVTINNDAHQRVARLQVPREADYRITGRGNLASEIEPELWFGHGGPAGRILAGGIAVTLLFVFVWITARSRR